MCPTCIEKYVYRIQSVYRIFLLNPGSMNRSLLKNNQHRIKNQLITQDYQANNRWFMNIESSHGHFLWIFRHQFATPWIHISEVLVFSPFQWGNLTVLNQFFWDIIHQIRGYNHYLLRTKNDWQVSIAILNYQRLTKPWQDPRVYVTWLSHHIRGQLSNWICCVVFKYFWFSPRKGMMIKHKDFFLFPLDWNISPKHSNPFRSGQFGSVAGFSNHRNR